MKKYSLALGGGSARGLIHIGILQYLEEKNIEIEEIAGTSMGAIIAAGKSFGFSSKELGNFFKEIDIRNFIDIDLSSGLLKGEKILKKLEEIFGSATFEDLNIKTKITAVDIEKGELKIFETGKVIDAIRCSISLPGIFKPYEVEGNKYIDGGIICNLPIDLLEGENKIAISATKIETRPLKLKKSFLGIEFSRSFFNVNWQILNRSLNILMLGNEKLSIKKTKGNIQHIQVDFGKLDLLDFEKVDKFIKLGYKYAKTLKLN